MLALPLLLFPLAFADPPGTCTGDAATWQLADGYRAQQAKDAEHALGAYRRCLALEPTCVPCQYEIGWSHWSRTEWDAAALAWEKTLALEPDHAAAAKALADARVKQQTEPPLRGPAAKYVPIGTTSGEGPIRLTLVHKLQSVYPDTGSDDDVYDLQIESPKSARYLSDGKKVYVNSLEGLRTVVYDPNTLQKLGAVDHVFDGDDSALFHGETTVFDQPYLQQPLTGDVNQFAGKPVEMALSHHERYLWVPYYRRDWDYGAGSPSAVAIIDTHTDQIVRVMPTGPIPKYVAISPDDHWASITHWGDNTVALIDISSGDPEQFAYYPERLVVEQVMSQEGLEATNRDSSCGFCLRGTTFTPDGKTLLVARMGGGGIAGFDVETRTYLGTVMGMKPTPRHLVISPDGAQLYLTSNKTGFLSSIPLDTVVSALRGADGARVELGGWREVEVGGGARTVEVSRDGRWLFVACNQTAEVVVVEAATMAVVARVRSDAWTVGLDIRPDGRQLLTTSQGHYGGGGNSVDVWRVDYAE